MKQTLHKLSSFASRNAHTLLALGIGASVGYNYLLSKRDKAFLKEKACPPTLPPLEVWPRLPKVSVLVAAWNEEANIERHIQSFLALRYPHKELILSAGGIDRTYPKAIRFAGDDLSVLEQQPGEGKQRALRNCLNFANGAVIFLTDADCRLDNDSFERTIYPVVLGRELACTGGMRPYPEMASDPFVVAQAAPHLYHQLHGPPYAPGLLGCNCAFDRQFLEACQGLEAQATTGTDYVLAKMISRAGVRICRIPESRVATGYPTSIRSYIRQKRRWLRNVASHGRRFGAKAEVRSSLFTSATGLGMLILPLSGVILGRLSLSAWFVLIAHAFLSRLRYLGYASILLGFRTTWRHALFQIPMLFLDFIAWSRPLLDYVRRDRKTAW